MGIAIDSNDNVWFAEKTGYKIGKMTQTGAFTEYPIPSGASPYYVAIDSNDVIWFTENLTNKIGKCTPAGVITEYSIPTADSNPWGIAIDSNNVMWFAEKKANKIGKMTQAGVCTEYSIPTGNSQPYKIAIDSNDVVWFTEFAGNKIGKCTPAGVITEYTIPTAGSEPDGIAINSTNHIWFTENLQQKVGTMTQAGAFTEYTTSLCDPLGIVIDGNDGVWFTEQRTTANKIAKLKDSLWLSVEVIKPAGGEIWYAGCSEEIEWNVTGGTAPFKIWLNYTIDDGKTWQPIDDVMQSTKGIKNYTWTIPNINCDDCHLNVVIVDNKTASDSKDTKSDNFTVTAPPVPEADTTLLSMVMMSFVMAVALKIFFRRK
jgi:virginiamycin B lyase